MAVACRAVDVDNDLCAIICCDAVALIVGLLGICLFCVRHEGARKSRNSGGGVCKHLRERNATAATARLDVCTLESVRKQVDVVREVAIRLVQNQA